MKVTVELDAKCFESGKLYCRQGFGPDLTVCPLYCGSSVSHNVLWSCYKSTECGLCALEMLLILFNVGFTQMVPTVRGDREEGAYI